MLEDRREYDAAALERLAEDTSGAVRARTALAMGRLRRPASAALLLPLLADPDTSVAATAAFALGQLGDSAHAAPLAARLASAGLRAPTVAAEAAYALGKVGGQTALAALEELLATRPVADSLAAPAIGSALLAVWKLPRTAMVGPLTRWLESPDPELRWRAAYALTRRPEPRALPLLRRALGDPDDRVRAQAVRGLTAASADSVGLPHEALIAELAPLLLEANYEVAINTARVLGSYSLPSAAAGLALAAASPNRHLALAATESLGRIGEAARAAAPGLTAAAVADSLPVALRAAALEALARLEPGAAAEVAARFAALPAWRLRAAAARAYASIGDGRGVRDGLADVDPRVANAALQAAIDEAGEDLVPVRTLLIEQLGATDPIIRATALTALARIPDPSLLPVLLDAYARAQRDTVNDASLAALDAVGAIADGGATPARAFLARFSRPDDALIRQRAVERLDSAAVVAAWGSALPVETGRSPAEYRALVDRFVAPALSGTTPPLARVVTDGDTIVLRLNAAQAPLTVESFLRLADAGFFDGQEWPRVVPNFVVQGGDPRGDTSGGPGYTIRDEINRHRYVAGTLGMALAGPDTGGSQFFITHSAQPHLDGTYAVFGQMVAGAPTTGRLLPGDTIDSIRSAR